MHDAGLNDAIGKNARNGLGKPLQAVHHGNQDVLGAAVLELIHHLEPELRPLGLLHPKPQDVLLARAGDADGQIHRLVANQAFVADLHPKRVEVNHRVQRLQRPVLPGSNLLEHRIRDRRNQRR